MKNIKSAIIFIAVLFLGSAAAVAQETEAVVIDEVVAQVNDSVITLSQIKREETNAVESLVKEGKTREEAQSLVASKKGELIANLINEELIVQKAKDYGLDKEVEARVNQQFLAKMRELNLTTLQQLYEAMEKSGVEPADIREFYRGQIMRDMVFEQEVDRKIYWGLNPREIKDYFEKNQTKFTKPETVTISEIFLGFAGRDEAVVREKAKTLIAELRAGGDFEKLAVENSDRPDVVETKGKAGTFTIDELGKIGPQFVTALKTVKIGGFAEPIERVEGMEIIRLDARTQASSESFFDENAVRRAIALERIPEARKKFMTDLRQDAYIKINDTYRPIVSPVLFADDRTTEKAGK